MLKWSLFKKYNNTILPLLTSYRNILEPPTVPKLPLSDFSDIKCVFCANLRITLLPLGRSWGGFRFQRTRHLRGVCLRACLHVDACLCWWMRSMPGSIRQSLETGPESGSANQDAAVDGVLLTRAAAVLVTIKFNTLAKDILKPLLNKCLKDTSLQQHMFSLWCITMAVPHQLSSSPGFLQPPPWLSLSPSARWEMRAQLIYLFVVETPRASTPGYRLPKPSWKIQSWY